MQKLEAAVSHLDDATREQEGLLATARQQIATGADHARARRESLDPA